jgi:ATP-dependent Clp endopeptidase proteolytic subunit ClpP
MNLKYRNHKNADSVAKFWGKPLDKPDWYKIENRSDDEAEILIYDIIGWPYNDASEFVRNLNGINAKTITVRINSPGGDVFDGTAIFNALANHKAKIITRVEGLAASMGSVLAMAGKEVQAYSNTMMMIHDPWVLAAGNQYDLRDIADLLEKIGENLLAIYTGKTKSGKKDMAAMMKAETWMTAKEAKEKGFVDTILESGKGLKAQFDLSVYANVPDDLIQCNHELTERDAEKALRDAGFSRAKAKALLAGRSQDTEGIEEIAAQLKNLTVKIGGK